MGRLVNTHHSSGMGFFDIFLRNIGELRFKTKLKLDAALEKASPETRKLMKSIMDDTNNKGRFDLNCWCAQMEARIYVANRQIGFILERNDVAPKSREYWTKQLGANKSNRKTLKHLRDLIVYVQYEIDGLASWEHSKDWDDESSSWLDDPTPRVCPKDVPLPAGLGGPPSGLGEVITALAITKLVIMVLFWVTIAVITLMVVKTIFDGLARLNGIDTPEQTESKAKAFLACLKAGGKATPEKCQKVLEKLGLDKTPTPAISGNTLIFLGLGVFVYAKYIMPAMKDK